MLADRIFVTLFRDRRRRGFPQPPDGKSEPDRDFTDDDYAPGPLDNPKRIHRTVRELLTTKFETDVYFVAYVNQEIPLRLNHGIWEHSAETFISVDAYDVDCPKALRGPDGDAPDTWWAAEREKIDRLHLLDPYVLAFRSRGGYRLIGARKTPFQINSDIAAEVWARDYILRGAWLHRAYGILVDPACRDFTRLQRVPHATREDGRTEPGIIVGDIDSFGAWSYLGMTLPAAEEALAVLVAANDNWKSLGDLTKHRVFTPVPHPIITSTVWDVDGPHVQAAIAHISKHFPKNNRHALCLAIGGMLRNLGASQEVAYYVVFEGARGGGSTDPRMRAKGASDTWRLGTDDAKTAFTTVANLIGNDAATKLGDLFGEAQREALLRKIRARRGLRAVPVTPAPAVPSVSTVSSVSTPNAGQHVDIGSLRKIALRVKRRKTQSDDKNQLVGALLLQRIVDGEPLAVPHDADEMTELSAEISLDRVCSVLAWNVPAGTPWEGVAALIERTVLEMVVPDKPLAYWMERAADSYQRAVTNLAVKRMKQEEDQREFSARGNIWRSR